MNDLREKLLSLEVAPGLWLGQACGRDAPKWFRFLLEVFGLGFILENRLELEANGLLPKSRVKLPPERLLALADELEKLKPELKKHIEEAECCNSAVLEYYSSFAELLRLYAGAGAPELSLYLVKYFMLPLLKYLDGKRYYEMLIYRSIVLDHARYDLKRSEHNAFK